MIELKPCPCCGSSRVDILKGHNVEQQKIWKAWCKSCQLRTWSHLHKKDAVSVWNTRPETAIADVEARVRQECIEAVKAEPDFLPTADRIQRGFVRGINYAVRQINKLAGD